MPTSNLPEDNKNNDSTHSSSSVFYWHKIILASVLILFIITNIALLKRYQYEKDRRIELDQKYKEVQSNREKMGLQQIANWQGELKAWPILEKAIVAFHEKQYEIAETELTKVIDVGIDLPIAHFLRAKVCFELGKNEKCIEDITKYHDFMPSSYYSLYLRAQCYFRLNQREKAIEELESAIQQTDDFVEAKEFLEKIRK